MVSAPHPSFMGQRAMVMLTRMGCWVRVVMMAEGAGFGLLLKSHVFGQDTPQKYR